MQIRNISLSHSWKQRDDGRPGSWLQSHLMFPLAWATVERDMHMCNPTHNRQPKANSAPSSLERTCIMCTLTNWEPIFTLPLPLTLWASIPLPQHQVPDNSGQPNTRACQNHSYYPILCLLTLHCPILPQKPQQRLFPTFSSHASPDNPGASLGGPAWPGVMVNFSYQLGWATVPRYVSNNILDGILTKINRHVPSSWEL